MKDEILKILKKHTLISKAVSTEPLKCDAWIDDSYYELMAGDILQLFGFGRDGRCQHDFKPFRDSDNAIRHYCTKCSQRL